MAVRFQSPGRALRPLWANPVVTRDLRVQLRGTRSYWHQAAYLLLLGLLAVAGYAQATSGYGSSESGISVVQVQGKLEQFYYFIFITLAALICLIAPALTASSITSERQRQSLDLLVTTPLTAGELLVGKLLSSVAFLALLLALSLPASALCVILGGATLGDVFRVYVLLAIDGLVLAAIGLYFSCAVKGSLLALVWTYVSVVGFLIVPALLGGGAGVGLFAARMGGGGASNVGDPLLAVGALNPFLAVVFGAKSFALAGVSVPVWVGSAVLAFLLIRLLVTAAGLRMGTFGTSAAGSLRRQLLLLTFLTMTAIAYALFAALLMGAGPGRGASSGPSAAAQSLMYVLVAAFILASPLWPSLFVPAVAEDAPPGTVIDGSYRPRWMFRAEHGGALPFFHLWLVTLFAAALAGWLAAGARPIGGGTLLAWTAYYLSGLGFLFWGLSRLAATLVRGVSGARALAFGLYVLLTALPLMIMGLSDQRWDQSLVAPFWLFYPLLQGGSSVPALLLTGTICYGVGVIVFPFWRAVVPGGLSKKDKKDRGRNATATT